MHSSRFYIKPRVFVLLFLFYSISKVHADPIFVEATIPSSSHSELLSLTQKLELPKFSKKATALFSNQLQIIEQPSSDEIQESTQILFRRGSRSHCSKQTIEVLKSALSVFERSDRIALIKKAYGCIIHHHIRNKQHKEARFFFSRVVSATPGWGTYDFSSEGWYQNLKQSRIHISEDKSTRKSKISLVVPSDKNIKINGRLIRIGKSSSRGRHFKITQYMVPGEYFVTVGKMRPRLLVIAPQGPKTVIFSKELEEHVKGERFSFASDFQRNTKHKKIAALMGELFNHSSVVVFWQDGTDVHLSRINIDTPNTNNFEHVVFPLESNPLQNWLLSKKKSVKFSPDFQKNKNGRYAVRFLSHKKQRISVVDHSLWPNAKSGDCETPCELFIPAGTLKMRTNGESVASGLHDLRLKENIDIDLKSPSKRLNFAGKVLTTVGGTVFLSTGLLIGGTCALADGVSNALNVGGNGGECSINRTAGGILLGSALLTGVGAAMWFKARTGIKKIQKRKIGWSLHSTPKGAGATVYGKW